MDNIVAGLNKIHCVCQAADNGKTVTVSNTYSTWTKELANNAADFIIPSMPAPEKKPYTIVLHNGDASAAAKYTRTIELGYGDSVEVGLYQNAEPATKGDIASVESDLSSLETRLIGRITYGTSDKVDGSSYLKDGYLYCYI